MADIITARLNMPDGNVLVFRDATAQSLIASMDLSSVGGSGKYIQLISQTDGKVSATAQSLVTTLDSSAVAPTSGAVKTYVDSKFSDFKFDFTVVSELPTASESTRKAIYLLSHSHGTSDAYDEYITVRTGTEGSYAYSWEKIGNTDIDLSNYLTTSSTATFTGTAANHKHTASFKGTTTTITPTVSVKGASYTPAGSISVTLNDYTPAGSVSLTNTSVTPTGSITVTGASYTPAGTVSTVLNNYVPEGSLSFTPSTTNVISGISGQSLPNLSFGIDADDDENLKISWTRGSYGTVSTASVMTSVKGTFTGTSKAPTIKSNIFTGTLATIKPTASFTGTEISVPSSASFTGTAKAPTIKSNTFTGTGATITPTVTLTGASYTPAGTITVDNTAVTPAGTIKITK